MFPGLAGAKIAVPPLYVEEVFSIDTDTGTGVSLSVINNIDLATRGGMVWIKSRSNNTDHAIYDTVRGVQNDLTPTSTAAQTSQAQGVTAFNSDRFTRGTLAKLNTNTNTYVSWTFRKSLKFFDVVTYVGNGSNRTIAHNLGVAPGMIIIKAYDGSKDWVVYHRSIANTDFLKLNTTAASVTASTYWNSITADASTFSLGSNADVNSAAGGGLTYVAYVFAHDTASDGMIQCGTYNGNGSGTGPVVTLGWSPQYILVKRTDSVSNWTILDRTRQLGTELDDGTLSANTTAVDSTLGAVDPLPTGFQLKTPVSALNASGGTYVYMAIRKPNMKVPTVASKVFDIKLRTGTGAATSYSGLSIVNGPDLLISKSRSFASGAAWVNRLTFPRIAISSGAAAVSSVTASFVTFDMSGVSLGADGTNLINKSGETYVDYLFKESVGFLDTVYYTGNGSAHTESHSLGVVPEMIIAKGYDATAWQVYHKDLTSAANILVLNTTAAQASSTTVWNSTDPTSSVFTVGTSANVNNNNKFFMAHLFATAPGVSKVSSYTGNATTNQINCGFASGARFVLIKRIDAIGDWYFWDTTRGIVSGNDPYLLMNSTATEVTSTDYIDSYSAGFELSSTAPTALNASGGTFIFLAIA